MHGLATGDDGGKREAMRSPWKRHSKDERQETHSAQPRPEEHGFSRRTYHVPLPLHSEALSALQLPISARQNADQGVPTSITPVNAARSFSTAMYRLRAPGRARGDIWKENRM